MDYGHSVEFGYFLIPDAGDPRGVLETARVADRLGYDLLARALEGAAGERRATRA